MVRSKRLLMMYKYIRGSKIFQKNTKNPPQGGLNFITFRNPRSLQNVRIFSLFHDPYRIIMLFETHSFSFFIVYFKNVSHWVASLGQRVEIGRE